MAGVGQEIGLVVDRGWHKEVKEGAPICEFPDVYCNVPYPFGGCCRLVKLGDNFRANGRANVLGK